MSVSSYVVINSGMVNVSDSVAEFTKALNEYVEEQKLQEKLSKVNEALSEFFDSHNKTVVAKSALVDMIVFSIAKNKNNEDPEVFVDPKLVSECIKSHIGDKASGKMLRMKKGAGGGISRWSDFEE